MTARTYAAYSCLPPLSGPAISTLHLYRDLLHLCVGRVQSLRRSRCRTVGWDRHAVVRRSLSASSWRSRRPSTTGKKTDASSAPRPSTTSTSTTTALIGLCCTFTDIGSNTQPLSSSYCIIECYTIGSKYRCKIYNICIKSALTLGKLLTRLCVVPLHLGLCYTDPIACLVTLLYGDCTIAVLKLRSCYDKCVELLLSVIRHDCTSRLASWQWTVNVIHIDCCLLLTNGHVVIF